ERGGTAGQPAHQPLVEERRDLAVEKGALLTDIARLDELGKVDAIELGEPVAGTDEAAEQASAIDVRAEQRDPPAPGSAPTLPEGAGLGIEIKLDMLPEGADVRHLVGLAEEAVERVPARQVADAGKLQPGERHMRAVEID